MEDDGGPGRAAALYSHFWMLRRVQRGYACFDAYARSLDNFWCFFQGAFNAAHFFWGGSNLMQMYCICIYIYFIYMYNIEGFPL